MKCQLYENCLIGKNKKKENLYCFKEPRQVGKTYLLKEFGNNEYDDLAYFNFEEDNYFIL